MTSLKDFQQLTDLEWRQHYETEHGMFIAEGLTTIERALAAGLVVRRVLTSRKWTPALLRLGIAMSHIEEQSDEAIEAVTGFAVHRGALAAFERPRMPDAEHLLNQAHRIIITEDIVDHANIGSLMRAAAAFGLDGVVLSQRCADPLYRRAIKVSMGTVFKVPWTRAHNAIALAHNHGFETLALTPDADATDIRALPTDMRSGRIGLILGSEGPGLSDAALSASRYRVRIPMANGVDSLNVSAAAAVACYELTR